MKMVPRWQELTLITATTKVDGKQDIYHLLHLVHHSLVCHWRRAQAPGGRGRVSGYQREQVMRMAAMQCGKLTI